MKTTDFEAISQGMIQKIYKVLFSKRAEYANDNDCLENFKQPTTLMGANPAEVCIWYDTKHFASLVKMAKDANQGKLPSIELLQEKVGDYLSYGLLYYACMVEMMAEQELNTGSQIKANDDEADASSEQDVPAVSNDTFPLPDQPNNDTKGNKRFWNKK